MYVECLFQTSTHTYAYLRMEHGGGTQLTRALADRRTWAQNPARANSAT